MDQHTERMAVIDARLDDVDGRLQRLAVQQEQLTTQLAAQQEQLTTRLTAQQEQLTAQQEQLEARIGRSLSTVDGYIEAMDAKLVAIGRQYQAVADGVHAWGEFVITEHGHLRRHLAEEHGLDPDAIG